MRSTSQSCIVLVVLALFMVSCAETSHSSAWIADPTTSVTEMIPLKYIDAGNAVARIHLNNADSRIVAEPATNSLVVVASPAEIDAVHLAVNRIDQPR